MIAVAVAIITVLVILFFGIWKLRAKGKSFLTLIEDRSQQQLKTNFVISLNFLYFPGKYYLILAADKQNYFLTHQVKTFNN